MNNKTIEKNKEDLDSQLVSALRFPLAVMVVCIHSYLPNEGNYFINMLSHVLSHIAVPLFFLFSGYYFFTGLHEWGWAIWGGKIKKRAKTLLLPYLVWILLFVLYSIAPSVLKSLITGNSFSLIEWFNTNHGFHIFWDSYQWNLDRVDVLGNPAISSAPILVPFWFLRDLIITVLMTPLMYILLKHREQSLKYLPIIVLLCLGVLYLSSISLIIPGLSINAILFFAIGAFCRLNERSLYCRNRANTIVYLSALVLLLADTLFNGHNTQIGNIIYKPWVLLGVYSAIQLMGGGIESKRFSGVIQSISNLSDTTFFIFAAHAFLLPYIKIVLNLLVGKVYAIQDIFIVEFANQHPFIISVVYVCLVFSTVFLCIVFYRIINKHCPRVSKLLTGR